MQMKNFKILMALAVVLATSQALAQDVDSDDEMEATMRLMGKAEAELPYAVIKEIKLPDSLLVRDPDSPAIANSAHGHATANENQLEHEEGLATADEARERGAEMSEQAKENQENHGRSEDRPEPPTPPSGPPNGPPGQN
jgi:hypothetical protein